MEGGGRRGSSVWISLALLTQMCLLSPDCLVGPVNTIVAKKKPALDLGELSRDQSVLSVRVSQDETVAVNEVLTT